MSSAIPYMPQYPGPTQYQAIIGSPSPANPDEVQYVSMSRGSFSDTLLSATKRALNFTVGISPTTTSLVATGVSALGQGAKAAGQGISKAATSATSGIKIGFALIIVLAGIILFAQVRRATG